MSEEITEKPKCSLCKKVGEDRYYYWMPSQRGKGGLLGHLSCFDQVRKATNNFGKGEGGENGS
jgi:hypothetical protein